MDPSLLISEIEEYLKNHDKLLNGPLYESLCKQTAKACLKSGLLNEGIFYLSESHAASLRFNCSHEYSLRLLKTELTDTNPQFGLHQKYVALQGSHMGQKYDGLLARLKEMPKEWTLVQITRSFESQLRWNTKLPNSVADVSDLHIVRYSCGNSREPCHVLIPKPEKNVGILKQLYNITVESWKEKRRLPLARIKQNRIEDNKQLKVIVKDIIQNWLKEWSCMLLGKFEDEEVENYISESIDKLLLNNKYQIDAHERSLLYQIANGSAHLSEDEIDCAVSQVIRSNSLKHDLCREISSIKDKYSNLIIAKRLPVILILDEKLEMVPWEMTSVLRKHPVCRIPSVHFAYAMYKEHEKNIINGNVIIPNCDLTFYIINPNQDLQKSEKCVTSFVTARFPKWKGLVGTAPSKNEFIEALANYNLFLYCGHGNGSQFVRSSDIRESRVKAIPLLFGCSSFQHKNLGGRTNFVSLYHSYIIAASPCMLGTLWPVTNTDTDCMALTLLNHWLPGDQLNLRVFEGFSEETVIPNQSFYEPELLRAMKSCRDSAFLFSNSASLVVYGLPVKVKNA